MIQELLSVNFQVPLENVLSIRISRRYATMIATIAISGFHAKKR
ncbi:MAG: hypothetical protein A4E42_01684 [Methanoregulaceae archaeon PtaU1.Bin222]|nr:MAG: hypothetical protein A4E42_01684 [Methanoregulaceae archaeon PtaU1.Bin222]